MRAFRFGLVFLALIIPASAAWGQNEQQCSALRVELAKTQQRLQAIDPKYKQGQNLALATDTLAGSIKALEGMSGDADKATKQLEKILKAARGRHAKLEEAIEDAMKATGKLSSQTKAVVDRLKQANKFLDIAHRAGTAPNATELAKAFDDYYQAIKGPLGPLVKTIPIVGGFLDAYGDAVHSAALSIAKIESIQNERRKLLLELTGKDYYRHQSKEEREWEQLTANAAALQAQLNDLDCDEEPPEPETPDVPQEILDKCQKSAGLSDNYQDEMQDMYRKIHGLRSALSSAKSAQKRSARHARDLQSSIDILTPISADGRTKLNRIHKRTVDLIRSLDNNNQVSAATYPPQYPTKTEIIIYRGQYLSGFKNTLAYSYIVEHLRAVEGLRQQDKKLDQLKDRLTDAKKQNTKDLADVKKAEAALAKLRETEAEYDRKVQAMTDCIEKEINKDKAPPEKKLPKCKPYNSILGALERVNQEMEGCSSD